MLIIENGPVEIVDLPIENGGSFHSFLYVYQRVKKNWCSSPTAQLIPTPVLLPGSRWFRTLFQCGFWDGWGWDLIAVHWLLSHFPTTFTVGDTIWVFPSKNGNFHEFPPYCFQMKLSKNIQPQEILAWTWNLEPHFLHFLARDWPRNPPFLEKKR